VNTVKVSWQDTAFLEGPKCDFCSGPLPLGLVAMLDLTAVGKTADAARSVLVGGQWAACPGCQGLMGIEPGAGVVALELVRRGHQEAVDRLFRRAGKWGLRHMFKSQVYGGGQGPTP